ncbi:MAG: mannose-1-phosphate guanylyltransferase/mannose-6-phosphate isomerase [Mariprofundales bacterium]|nr:mannose-1-phosphate guanylyltransferase/mannose-6-phosphate isomerase [Mariprofundales bacterium]
MRYSSLMNQIYAIILAGGSGTRLWPLSRQQLPKQFLQLNGDDTMLAATLHRLDPIVTQDHAWVVTSEQFATGEACTELEQLHTILEPVGRNTAPAIAIAAALLQDQYGGDPVQIVLPADHLIRDTPAFHSSLTQAISTAQAEDVLVTFGITPTHPDTGFGYIEAEGEGTARRVKRFIEKPDLDTATHFLTQGGFFWNSGMFVWRSSTILAEITRHLPEVAEIVTTARQAWQTRPWQQVIREQFANMPSISIDYGVLEHSSCVKLVPCDPGWSDIGSWDAVLDTSIKDSGGNAVAGDVIALNCKNSLIRSRSRLIAAIGLEGIIAVETPDAILLARRGDSQRVREVVEQLKSRGGSEHIEHLTVRRPWGSYTVLDDRACDYKLKRIEVAPGGCLSLQRHQHRSEHWIVVSGTATVTRGDEVFTVAKNASTYIPIGETHRLENRGKIPLQIVEVQVGEYLGEDDIERMDDRYGRTESTNS